MLFFAYRDFTAKADQTLAAFRIWPGPPPGHLFRRAAIPGMTVSDLLGILRITKQSLSRVLGQLVRQGFIVQKPGATDRRQRLLSLTEKGAELERKLTEEQRALIARAYRSAGADAVEGFRKVLLGMIEEADRRRFRPSQPR